MMKCPNCQSEVRPELRFCPECGTKLAATIPPEPIADRTAPTAPAVPVTPPARPQEPGGGAFSMPTMPAVQAPAWPSSADADKTQALPAAQGFAPPAAPTQPLTGGGWSPGQQGATPPPYQPGATPPPYQPGATPPYQPSGAATQTGGYGYGQPHSAAVADTKRPRPRWMIPVIAGVLVSALLGGAFLIFGVNQRGADRIAYLGNDGNIHVINADGTDDRTITTDGEPIEDQDAVLYLNPRWSPNGQRIAANRFDSAASSPNTSLLTMNAQGAERRSLYDQDLDNPNDDELLMMLQTHSWSADSSYVQAIKPDGSNFSAALYRDESNPSEETFLNDSGDENTMVTSALGSWHPTYAQLLYTVFDSEPVQTLIATGDGAANGSIDFDDDAQAHLFATWSPDGKQIAYVGSESDGGRSDEAAALWISDTDGKNTKELIKLPSLIGISSWAPDSQAIAYITSDSDAETIETHIYDLKTKKDRKIGEITLADDDQILFLVANPPRWSPDSSRLLYWTGNERIELSVAARSGENKKRIFSYTTDELAVLFFVGADWSSDSRSIVYALPDTDGNNLEGEIMVVNADGSGKRILADGLLPDWSP